MEHYKTGAPGVRTRMSKAVQEQTEDDGIPPHIKRVSAPYRRYALGLLFLVYVFNFIDRSILGILVEPIRTDLGVSDTLMGLLGGIAFAFFYTMLGIPIARMADKGSRRNILAVCPGIIRSS